MFRRAKWLSEHHRWLLVFDNADRMETVVNSGFFPPDHVDGDMILTTRVGSEQLQQHGVTKHVELLRLDLPKAVLLLWRAISNLSYASDADAANALFHEHSQVFREALEYVCGPKGADGYPLALLQVAAQVVFVVIVFFLSTKKN